jgi:hypothetical protein
MTKDACWTFCGRLLRNYRVDKAGNIKVSFSAIEKEDPRIY